MFNHESARTEQLYHRRTQAQAKRQPFLRRVPKGKKISVGFKVQIDKSTAFIGYLKYSAIVFPLRNQPTVNEPLSTPSKTTCSNESQQQHDHPYTG
jgi:hypothetical protein